MADGGFECGEHRNHALERHNLDQSCRYLTPTAICKGLCSARTSNRPGRLLPLTNGHTTWTSFGPPTPAAACLVDSGGAVGGAILPAQADVSFFLNTAVWSWLGWCSRSFTEIKKPEQRSKQFCSGFVPFGLHSSCSGNYVGRTGLSS